MSYQALARQWRPRRFSEVVGQDHVVTALSNALDAQRVHHAFLFTGTRGVGKTTLARIFAKALNCEQGMSATPCGECATCQSIDDGRFIDLLEVDAASKTKVDDTRELLDNVQYTPTQGRYKVYLIDEVHMLTGASFNALLKTLEEPPAYVKFLLATTDPQKLPATILSRCIQFHLKAMDIPSIIGQLQLILDAESIVYEDMALHAVAMAANGSMRDALSLLDQAIAYGHGQLKTNDVQQMLGIVDQQYCHDLLQAVITNDAPALVATMDNMASHAVDYLAALNQMLTLLHDVAMHQTAAEALQWKNIDLQHIATFSSKIDAELLQLLYQIALIGKRDFTLHPEPRMGFAMVMLRMLAFQPSEPGKEQSLSSSSTQSSATAPQQTASTAASARSLSTKADVQAAAPMGKPVDQLANQPTEVADTPASATADTQQNKRTSPFAALRRQTHRKEPERKANGPALDFSNESKSTPAQAAQSIVPAASKPLSQPEQMGQVALDRRVDEARGGEANVAAKAAVANTQSDNNVASMDDGSRAAAQPAPEQLPPASHANERSDEIAQPRIAQPRHEARVQQTAAANSQPRPVTQTEPTATPSSASSDATVPAAETSPSVTHSQVSEESSAHQRASQQPANQAANDQSSQFESNASNVVVDDIPPPEPPPWLDEEEQLDLPDAQFLPTSSSASASHGAASGKSVDPQDFLDPLKWAQFVKRSGLNGMQKEALMNMVPQQVDEHKIVLAVNANHENLLNNPQRMSKIEDYLAQYHDLQRRMVVTVNDAGANNTPSQQDDRKRVARQRKAEDDFKADQNVQQLIDLFDAEVITESITPGANAP